MAAGYGLPCRRPPRATRRQSLLKAHSRGCRSCAFLSDRRRGCLQMNAKPAATAAPMPISVAGGSGRVKPMAASAMKAVTAAVMNTAGMVANQWNVRSSARLTAAGRRTKTASVRWVQPKWRPITPKSENEIKTPTRKSGTTMARRLMAEDRDQGEQGHHRTDPIQKMHSRLPPWEVSHSAPPGPGPFSPGSPALFGSAPPAPHPRTVFAESRSRRISWPALRSRLRSGP